MMATVAVTTTTNFVIVHKLTEMYFYDSYSCYSCCGFIEFSFWILFFNFFFFLLRYSGEFEPYIRPDTQLGFIVDGQAVDEYGRPIGMYRPPSDYQQMYLKGNLEDDYIYSSYAYQR